MLLARATLKAQYEKLHKAVLAIVREDAVCRRLMTVPGVGPVVAVTFKSAVDDPSRIGKSKAVGALVGLTPKNYQSGLARKIGVILHRMWIDGTTYRWAEAKPIAVQG